MNEELKDNTVVEETVEGTPVAEEIAEEPIEVYEYADGSIYCHSCGNETSVEHPGFINVNGGVSLPLTANNKSYLTLACNNCGSKLTLHFVPAVNPPVDDVEVVNNEVTENVVQEENQEEASV